MRGERLWANRAEMAVLVHGTRLRIISMERVRHHAQCADRFCPACPARGIAGRSEENCSSR
jgi:hypothetical protein